MKVNLKVLGIITALLVVVVLAGCAGATQPPAPTQSTPTPTPTSSTPAVQPTANPIAAGQAKFEQSCSGCHGTKGDNVKVYSDLAINSMVKSFTGSQDELSNFIQQNTPMSDDGTKLALTLSKGDSQALAAYIWSGKGQAENIQPITLTGDVSKGGQLFDQFGCADCHGAKGDNIKLTSPGYNTVVKHLASDPSRLAGFLKVYAPMTDAGTKDPKSYLTDQQSADLAAYVWSLSK